MLMDFKVALNGRLIVINPWTHNKIVACRENISTLVKEHSLRVTIFIVRPWVHMSAT